MLTPETIASRRFDKQMGGYKQDEVEEFLQQVAAEYAQLPVPKRKNWKERLRSLLRRWNSTARTRTACAAH